MRRDKAPRTDRPSAQPTASRSTQAADELQLVEGAKRGDESAFSRLVFPYLRRIYFVALKITRNREDAEDASQQAFLKALAHIGQFRGGSQFSTWLTRIAMNEALMVRRKRRYEHARFTHDVDFGTDAAPETSVRAAEALHPEAVFARNENQRVLREAIESLRVTLRMSVYELGLEEHKCQEAAGMLHLTQAALKTRFMRARFELRQSLTERF